MTNRLGDNRMKSRGICSAMAVCVGLSLLAGPLAAQETSPGPRRVEASGGMVEPQGVDIKDGAVLLSLNEAVEIALRQNLGLAVQRYTRTRAQLGVKQTLGIYDLLLSGTAYGEDTKNATTSELQASQSNLQRLNVSATQRLLTGGDLQVNWTNSRTESNNRFTTLNPSFDSSFGFVFTQQLLQNGGRLANEYDILVAQNRSLASSQEFENQVTSTVQQVINAYWNLVGARQQLGVAQQSLKLAQDLHERNRIQVDVGTMPPLELVQSEATIAERDEGIITAQSAVGDAEDELRRLLNLPQGEIWGTEIRPVTDPTSQHVPIDVDAAIAEALDRRPELQIQDLDIEQAKLAAAYARNQELPSLRLRVGYDYSGVGGTVILRDRENNVIGTIPGTYSDSLSQIGRLDFPGWFGELIFGYPLQNRAARAARAIADLDLERAEAARADARNSVITEVRQAARRVETAAKQIEAAKASRVFQERNLDAERKRYENGMSTSFQITQIQDDLSQAQSREVNAVISYRTAVAELERTLGRLLQSEGIEIADQEPVIDRWDFSLGR